MRRSNFRLLLACLLGSTIVSLILLELLFRHSWGYSLSHLALKKNTYWRNPVIYKWNTKFPKNNHLYFPGMPEFYDPRYEHLPFLLNENISIPEKQRYYLKPFPDDDEFAYTANNLGFRGTKQMEPAKKRGVKRIFLVGASTIEFTQFKNTSLPQLLESRLLKTRMRGDTFEVVNAGMADAGAKDHLELIKNRILPLEPDLILYYWSPRQEIWRGSEGIGCRAKKSKYRDSCWLLGQNPLFRLLYTGSVLFRFLAKNYPFLQRDLSKLPPEHVYRIDKESEFAREYALDLDKLMLFAQQAKAPLMAVETTAATMSEGFGRPFEPGSLMESTMEIDLYPLTQKDINAFFALSNEVLFSVASASKIPVCKMRRRLAVGDFLDHVHFSEKGLPKVADWFAECADRYFHAHARQ